MKQFIDTPVGRADIVVSPNQISRLINRIVYVESNYETIHHISRHDMDVNTVQANNDGSYYLIGPGGVVTANGCFGAVLEIPNDSNFYLTNNGRYLIENWDYNNTFTVYRLS